MLSLAFYAAYDPVTPASRAGLVVTGLLRARLGFDGVAITDDLGAAAEIELLADPPVAGSPPLSRRPIVLPVFRSRT